MFCQSDWFKKLPTHFEMNNATSVKCDPRIWHLPISSIWLEKKKRNLIWTRKIIQLKKEITKSGWKIVKKRCKGTLNIKLTGLSRTCCSLNVSQQGQNHHAVAFEIDCFMRSYTTFLIHVLIYQISHKIVV